MKKAFLVTIVTLLTLFTATAGENRLKSLGAKSPMGSYLTPDSWCDPFYVNPAFAASNDSFLVMQENSLGMVINNNYSRSLGTELTLRPLHRLGLFLPYKNFRWGAELTVNRSYYGQFIDSSYTGSDIIGQISAYNVTDNLMFDGKTLFAWQLSEVLSVGFLLGGSGMVYYDNNSISQGSLVTVDSYERYLMANFSVYENVGLLFTKGMIETAFALPFSFSFNKYRNDADYVTAENDYRRAELSYLFDFELTNVTTLNFSDRHFLRINSGIGLETDLVGYEYNSLFYPTGPDTLQKYRHFELKERVALTMHHRLKEGKSMILYGVELRAFSLFGIGSDDNYSTVTNRNGFNLSTNFGGSFAVKDKLTINFGVDTLILMANFYNRPVSSQSSYYYSFWFQRNGGGGFYRPSGNGGGVEIAPAFATNINLGFDIRPIKGFTIEVGASLNGLSPLLAVVLTDRIVIAPRVDLAFTWDITELKAGKAKDVEAEAEEL